MALALENKLQEWRTRVQSGAAAAYLRWWLGELKALLPESWQQKLRHAMRRVTVQISGESILLGVEENQSIEPLESFSTSQDASLQRQQTLELLGARELFEVPRILLLDNSEVLRKEVRLPEAAESNLRQVLGFEMDRQTPFRADDVYFDWRILGHDKEAGQVRVDLIVAPRVAIDAICQNLSARGLSVSGVDVIDEGESLGVNLLPPERRVRIVNRKVRLNQGLAAATVVLLAVVMALSLSLRAHQVSELDAAIESVREEALRVQRIRDQINDTSEAAGFLAQRRMASPVAVDILADVTRTLPDDTYLDRLVIGPATVQMQGKSQNAQQLIEQVNESPLMEAASFRGSTRLDARTGLEIFEINAVVTPEDIGPGGEG